MRAGHRRARGTGPAIPRCATRLRSPPGTADRVGRSRTGRPGGGQGSGPRGGRLLRARVPGGVEESHQQLHAADPVCEGVVHLLHQSGVPAGQPLHEDELPEGSRPVESGLGQMAGEIEQPVPAGGFGRRDRPQVVVDVRGRIVHPSGPAQPEGRLDHALVELGAPLHRLLDARPEPVSVRQPVEQRDGGDGRTELGIALDGPHHRVASAHRRHRVRGGAHDAARCCSCAGVETGSSCTSATRRGRHARPSTRSARPIRSRPAGTRRSSRSIWRP